MVSPREGLTVTGTREKHTLAVCAHFPSTPGLKYESPVGSARHRNRRMHRPATPKPRDSCLQRMRGRRRRSEPGRRRCCKSQAATLLPQLYLAGYLQLPKGALTGVIAGCQGDGWGCPGQRWRARPWAADKARCGCPTATRSSSKA